MKIIEQVAPADTQMQVAGVVTDATEIAMLWDECSPGEKLSLRYETLRSKLSDILGVALSKGTAFMALESAVAMIAELKKNCIHDASSKS